MVLLVVFSVVSRLRERHRLLSPLFHLRPKRVHRAPHAALQHRVAVARRDDFRGEHERFEHPRRAQVLEGRGQFFDEGLARPRVRRACHQDMAGVFDFVSAAQATQPAFPRGA